MELKKSQLDYRWVILVVCFLMEFLCLGSPLGDLYFDLFGTYKPCFWFFTLLMIAVAMGYRFVIRAAYRDKVAVLAATA